MMEDTVFIDSLQGIKDLVDWVAQQDTWTGDLYPPLYIDLEGQELSRNGHLSLMTVLVYPGKGPKRSYIIDVHTLKDAAFSTTGTRDKSLKDILESSEIRKVFFDVRNDSDALYSHYGIKLHGVMDVQLMESAVRPGRRRFLFGLSKCIEQTLQGPERKEWLQSKENGDNIWNPKKGGSYDAFNERPLRKEIVSYCVGDVQQLPALYRKYRRGTDRWLSLIAKESEKRIDDSQTAGYKPNGAHKAISPWSIEQNKMLNSWSELPEPRSKQRGMYFCLEDMFEDLQVGY